MHHLCFYERTVESTVAEVPVGREEENEMVIAYHYAFPTRQYNQAPIYSTVLCKSLGLQI